MLKNNIISIGHRGFRVGVDENTFNSFNKSVELNLDYFECDVQATKDNRLVIIHDNTVDRIFNGRGKVRDFTLSDIKKLKSKQRGFEIPTLDELLDNYSDKIKLMLEIKDQNISKMLANKIVSKNIVNRVVVSGRDPNEFKIVKEIIPKAKFCLNITKCQSFPVKTFLKIKNKTDLPFQFDMISLSVQKMSKKFIDKCLEFNILPLCWNFINEKDPVKITRKMIDMGIKGILFDDPEVFKIIKKEYQ